MTTPETAAILTRAAELYAVAPCPDLRAAIGEAAGDWSGEVVARGVLCNRLGLPVRGYTENGYTLADWAEGCTRDEVIAALRGDGAA